MRKAPDQTHVSGILQRLDTAYGTEDIIYLTHEKDWQLLVAVILIVAYSLNPKRKAKSGKKGASAKKNEND